MRDKVKDHGTKKLIDGYIPNGKDVVCVVDDVFTTGSSIYNTKEKLETRTSRFTKPVVVLNRSKDKKALSLLAVSDLKKGSILN